MVKQSASNSRLSGATAGRLMQMLKLLVLVTSRMHLVPKKFFVSSGCAVSKVSDLNAFDKALLEAGIGELNIVSVSSILPIGAEQVLSLIHI